MIITGTDSEPRKHIKTFEEVRSLFKKTFLSLWNLNFSFTHVKRSSRDVV